MKEMEEMTRIGTGYFLTTPVFDVDQFEKFLSRTKTFGVPVIAEVIISKNRGHGQVSKSSSETGPGSGLDY